MANIFKNFNENPATSQFVAVPCGGDAGKEALYPWSRLARGVSAKHRKYLVGRFPEYNVGLITGPCNRVTVVDVDNGKDLDRFIALAGDTPLIVKTYRGFHLYYKYNEENVKNLRAYGYEGDVKGRGGYVMAPPSIRYESEIDFTYSFHRGDYSLITSDQLPAMKSLEGLQRVVVSDDPVSVRVGERDDWLFKRLLKEAKHCDGLEDLSDVAITLWRNLLEDNPAHPFTEQQALQKAKQAWGYEQSGSNWASSGGVLAVRSGPFKVMLEEANIAFKERRLSDASAFRDAAAFIQYLLYHNNRGDQFNISAKAIYESGSFPASEQSIRRARDLLVKHKVLELVYRGGNFGQVSDPSQYRLL